MIWQYIILKELPPRYLKDLDKKLQQEVQEHIDCKHVAQLFPDESIFGNEELRRPKPGSPTVTETRETIRNSRRKLYPNGKKNLAHKTKSPITRS